MNINRKSFFDCFRTFHKSVRGNLPASQVSALSFLLDQIEADTNWRSVQHVAYFLATIAHETAWTFEPIIEYRGKALSSAQRKYWPSGYYGRGYVQLTWDYNYEKAGEKLGIDLLVNPSLALEPATAYRIAAQGMREGWFTGKHLYGYINSKTTDYKEARRIINGTDKAALIAGYAKSIEGCLTGSLELKDAPAQPEAQEQPVGPTVNVEQAQNVTAPPPPVKGGSVGDVPQEVAQTKPSWITRIIGVATGIATPLGAAGIKLGGFQISSAAVIAMCAFGIVGLIIGAWIYNEGQKRAARLTELQLLNRARPAEINVELKQ